MGSKRVYNEEGKITDYRKKKVTDTNLKKRITVPGPVGVETEGKILSLASILENIVKGWKQREEIQGIHSK